MFTKRAIRLLSASNVDMIPIGQEDVINRVFAFTINDPENGNPLVKSNDVLDEEILEKLKSAGITEFEVQSRG